MYKHFVKVDANNIVTKGFSDAFEQPIETDILIAENEERHFHLVITQPLVNPRGQYLLKYIEGEIVERSQQELEDEWNDKPPLPPTLEQRLLAAEQALLAMMEVFG